MIRPHITLSQLIRDLKQLGLEPGRVVMLHASVRSLGWVVGGPEQVLEALFETLGPTGTLMMIASWEDKPYELASWPPARAAAAKSARPICLTPSPSSNLASTGWSARLIRDRPFLSEPLRGGKVYSYKKPEPL